MFPVYSPSQFVSYTWTMVPRIQLGWIWRLLFLWDKSGQMLGTLLLVQLIGNSCCFILPIHPIYAHSRVIRKLSCCICLHSRFILQMTKFIKASLCSPSQTITFAGNLVLCLTKGKKTDYLIHLITSDYYLVISNDFQWFLFSEIRSSHCPKITGNHSRSPEIIRNPWISIEIIRNH
jgi:hypothetical protein